MTYLHPSMKRTRPIPKMSKKRRRAMYLWGNLTRARIAACNRVCEASIEGTCDGAPVHGHHVRPRAQGGSDTADNLLAVCLSCHQYIHARPAQAQAWGLLRMRKEVSHV